MEKEPGFTQIPHEALEKLARTPLSPSQWRVLLFIIRKTLGWHKEVDYIANFQIVEATGLCKAVVSRCLEGLNDLQIITRKGKLIGFQKDWERWGELAESSTSGSKLAELSTPEKLAIPSTELAIPSTELAIPSTKVSSPAVTQKIKNTITKDTIQKKAKFILPDWIDKDTWGAFLEMRKKKRAVPTERAKQLLVKELGKLRGEGNDPNEVLNQSIMRNYTGVFPLKGGRGVGTYQYGNREPSAERYRQSLKRPSQLEVKHDVQGPLR